MFLELNRTRTVLEGVPRSITYQEIYCYTVVCPPNLPEDWELEDVIWLFGEVDMLFLKLDSDARKRISDREAKRQKKGKNRKGSRR